jgi:non-ribosomal peptide synthetase component F
MVQELEVDPDVLDGYLESGVSLAELRHAAKVAEQTDSDWEMVADAHAADHGWGEIKQAFRLSSEEAGFTTIMDIGVQEYRRQQREDSREERQTEREVRSTNSKATQIANQNGVSEAEVVAIYDGACEGDWGCVRAHFRELSRNEARGGPPEGKGKDNQGKGKDKE